MSYSVGESWGGLRQAWKGYKIAFANKQKVLQSKYAYRVRKIQSELGLPLAQFPHLGIVGKVRDEGEQARQANIEKETAGAD